MHARQQDDIGIRTLGEYLARQAAAGILDIADAEAAASHFIQLCQGDLFRRLLFGVIREAHESEIEAAAEQAAGVFMRAFATPPARGS
ncbi:MAG: hypothetical protein B7Z81_07830 [Acidocella sp. 20-61-6]|nr:MAG: hypothetical protein B7Z81_07830 [Acidocella sp. 20-61-6]